MKFIGEKISLQKKDGIFSVVIAAAIERYQEGLVLVWALTWTLCGSFFIVQLIWGDDPRETKLYMVILLSFWAYYEYKAVSIFFWRKWGYESLKMMDGRLYLRNVVKGMGKTKDYFLENIDEFYTKKREAKSFVEVMNNTFWVKGNHSVYFKYQGKTIGLGRQIDIEEAKKLCAILNYERKQCR